MMIHPDCEVYMPKRRTGFKQEKRRKEADRSKKKEQKLQNRLQRAEAEPPASEPEDAGQKDGDSA